MPKKPTEVSGTFGKLTVIHCNLPPRKRILVRCQCGTEFATTSYDLLNKRTESCGNTPCSTRSYDLHNQRFGYLTVYKLSSARNSRGELVWICKCDCGRKRRVKAANLLSGGVKSCGCKRDFLKARKLIKDPKKTLLTILFARYRSGAKYRKYSFRISKKFVQKLIFSNCHYCGTEPLAEYKLSNLLGDTVIKYNGVDRVNNNKGYFASNCVTACKICNAAKSDFSVEEFDSWIAKIVKHNKSKL